MKKVSALLFLTLYSCFAFACSTFLLSKNGHHYFGRNYDWVSGNGIIVVNARGIKKESFSAPGASKISWASECGSITFNQFGKEFPHGGMNEMGLVVELMWLQETGYAAPDSRAGVNELQWIQYQLDNCATVDEVIATDALIRIDREGAAPLHFLVADALGDAATIEFIGGKMVVHRKESLQYPVLTNTPYSEAINFFRGAKNGGTAAFDNSVARFATACRMVYQFQQVKTNENGVDYAFSILDKVAQGDYTKWRIVYDITSRSISFITVAGQERRMLSFTNFDFSCNRPPLSFNLTTKASGSIVPHFKPLSFTENKRIIEQSVRESRSAIQIPEVYVQSAALYFNNVRCN